MSTALNASSASVALVVDSRPCIVPEATSVAAALLGAGIVAFRQSVTGQPRTPLCGMGICYECRLTIDGVANRRACLVTVADGMHIETATLEVHGR